MSKGDSKKVVVAALLANLGIALVKGVAAVATRSGAMLAETVHSLADSGNQALLLLGAARSRRPPDRRHPFGYGSERYFWAFIVALVLFALGALFSVYEGIEKLLHPAPIRNVVWAYAVLGASLVLELVSFRVARREIAVERRGRSFARYFVETKDPSLPLVFLEDLGALFGLAFALGGVAASHALGWTRADGIATLLIGGLLGTIAAVLLVRCHRLLIGEGATDEDIGRIRAAVVATGGEVVDIRTLQLGPDNLVVGLEVRLEGSVAEVERAIREAVPNARYVAIEPA
ncbi:MAG TPA: cation diffusion facilitator family transporter [Planctomycetota bacterium]|nr:cation diffusion facilitator family transporter [Planctomycetota bacterium]